jgi:curved DNA-binding protein CbpA
MNEFVNYYDVLQVSPKASMEVIKVTYRQLSKMYHPDSGVPNDEAMKVINQAYEILSDPVKRAEYDELFYQHSKSAHVKPDSEEPANKESANNATIPHVRPWVRYWARMIDIMLIGIAFGFVVAAFELDMSGVALVDSFMFLVAWIFIEPLLLTQYGATFGKWLLKTEVKDPKGNNLSYNNALRRSFWVWLLGTGAGIPLANIFAWMYGYNQLVNNGTTIWDYKGTSVVTHKNIGVLRIIVAVLIIVVPLVISAGLE